MTPRDGTGTDPVTGEGRRATTDEPTAVRLHRPWLAPAVASAIAALVLLALLLAPLLRYPNAASSPGGEAALDAQRQTNQALREQLDRLRHSSADVCQVAPGGPEKSGGIPLLPPLPTQTAVSLPAPAGVSPTVGTLAGLLERATVLVLAGDSLGSGFFISPRHVVTNHHVVGDARQVRVGSRTLGGFIPAHVVAVGRGDARGTQDLAVIEVEPQAAAIPLQLGVVPQRLDAVTAAGYPGAVLETVQGASAASLPEANFTQGILTSRQQQAPAGIGTIIHTAQIGHGNSGGPLVDAGGCVIGVNSWLSVDAEDQVVFSTFFQALDAGELRRFLTEQNVAFSATDAACKPVQVAAGSSPAPGAAPLPPAAKP